MSAITLFTFAFRMNSLRQNLTDISAMHLGARRAVRGEDPFLFKRKVETAIKDIESLICFLETLPQTGIKEMLNQGSRTNPIENFLDPQRRATAVSELNRELKRREEAQADARKFIEDLARLVDESRQRAKVLFELADTFEKLVERTHTDIGTLNRTAFFKYSQLCSRAGRRMNRVTEAARHVLPRIQQELRDFQQETNILRSNLSEFL